MSERTILCYGDSNTHGAIAMRHFDDIRRYPPAVRWPGVAAAALGTGFRVIEEGLPGRTTVHPDPVGGGHLSGMATLQAILNSHRPLDLVVLMLGTNDCKARFALPPFDIAASVALLAQAVAASGCGPEQGAPVVLVVAPVPVDEVGWLAQTLPGAAEKSRALAAHLRDFAALAGAGFLDAGAVAAVDPVDGVHLLEAGHAALGRAVAGAVRAALG